MTKAEKMEQIKVYKEFVNYIGEVSDSVEIATFRNINWAKSFMKDLLNDVKEYHANGERYKVQFGDGRKFYITHDGRNEFVNSLI